LYESLVESAPTVPTPVKSAVERSSLFIRFNYPFSPFHVLFFLASLCLPSCQEKEINEKPEAFEEKLLTFRDQLFGVSAADPKNVWVVGDFGIILHSGSGGDTWVQQDSGTGKALLDVDFVDSKKGWAVGQGGLVIHTSDGGMHWTPQQSNTDNRLMSVDFATAKKGIAVGVLGTILETDNGGITWTNRSMGEDVVLNEVFLKDPGHGWIVGEFGTILRTEDGGVHWTRQESGIAEASLFGVFFLNAADGWAVGQDGILLTSRNKGKDWTRRQPDFGKTLFDVAVTPVMGYIIGADGLVLEKKGDWVESDRVIAFSWLRDLCLVDKTGWMVGDRGMVLKTADGGEAWTFVLMKEE